MSAVEVMDETIEQVIETFKDDCVFDYAFDGVEHIVKSDDHSIHITAEASEDCDEWEVYAEIKNSKGEKIDSFFDSDDTLDDLETDRFKNLFEYFFEHNILSYVPFVDED